MPQRYVEIGLKIPDNTAYTALVALRRLGLEVARVERGEIRRLGDDKEGVAALRERIEADETIFNPNIHRLTVRETDAPQMGEVWIEPLHQCHPERSAVGAQSKDLTAISWRLFDPNDAPLSDAALQRAVDRLLCNPAIERAIVGSAR